MCLQLLESSPAEGPLFSLPLILEIHRDPWTEHPSRLIPHTEDVQGLTRGMGQAFEPLGLERGEKIPAEVVVYFPGTAAKLYQITDWRPVLETSTNATESSSLPAARCPSCAYASDTCAVRLFDGN
jgi:hypothetical protein